MLKHMSLSAIVAWCLFAGVFGLSAIGLVTSRFGWRIYLELLSHFQLQYLVLSLIGLVGLALTHHKALFLIGLLCVAALATQIVSWYVPPKFLFSDSGNFRILIANINTQNQQYEQVVSFAQQENPDLALFMEVNETWVNNLDVLLDDLPYSDGQDNPFNFGIVLYSRYPLQNTQLKSFSADSTPSVVGSISVSDRPLSFVATHPLPPIRPAIFHSRNNQLNLVSEYLQTVDDPTLVIGDFNITMWSPYYRRFIRRTGLENARRGFGLLPSWPTERTYGKIPGWASLLFSIPIDHCLLSPDLTVTDVRVGPNVGSDHRPVIVDLRLEGI
jgi:endonuclease/exonuclease/phosphatase (EEP) superfamily protein YafD